MPKGTRVHRCVHKLKKTYSIGHSIAICQKSTKQNYRTGKTLRNKTKNGKKTRKNRGGRKTKKRKNTKISKIVSIFKQYPNIFPRGYFRFLESNLEERIKNKEIIFKNGVVLTWKIYKKNPGRYKNLNIQKGDVKIHQFVNKNEGNGKAKKIFLAFLNKHNKTNIVLDVRSNNKRAIRFYKKNGFKKVGNTKFGDLSGIIMRRKSI